MGEIEMYLEVEIGRLTDQLSVEIKNKQEFERDWLECCDKLAASQAREKVLLECLDYIDRTGRLWGGEAMRSAQLANAARAQPTDDSALKALLAAERERCAKVCERQYLGAPYQGDVYAIAIRALGDSD